jgi:hypothetical protein
MKTISIVQKIAYGLRMRNLYPGSFERIGPYDTLNMLSTQNRDINRDYPVPNLPGQTLPANWRSVKA